MDPDPSASNIACSSWSACGLDGHGLYIATAYIPIACSDMHRDVCFAYTDTAHIGAVITAIACIVTAYMDMAYVVTAYMRTVFARISDSARSFMDMAYISYPAFVITTNMSPSKSD